MENVNLKKQNGVTLVALVITIIVLLILASVSFNALLGESGILTKASGAKNVWEIEEFKEEVILHIADIKIQAVKEDEQFTMEYVYDNLEESEKYDEVIHNPDETITVKRGGLEALINENFGVYVEGTTK